MSKRKLHKVPSEFKLTAAAVMTFADDDEKSLPTFTLNAYNGGPMRFWQFYHPVVIDLRGLKVGAKKRPALYSHDRLKPVGHTVGASKGVSSLALEGVMSVDTEDSRMIVSAAQNGFQWQVSVGVKVTKIVLVAEGKTVKVNGELMEGPLYVAKKSELQEVSFVTLGADDTTSAKIAAMQADFTQEGSNMKYEEWLAAKGFDGDLTEEQEVSLKAMYKAEMADLKAKADANKGLGKVPVNLDAAETPAPVATAADAVAEVRAAAADEKLRIIDINTLEADFDGADKIKAEAIKGGVTVIEAELNLLRAGRPKPPAIHQHAPTATPDVLEAAVCLATSLPAIEDHFPEQTLDAAHTQFRNQVGLQEILLAAAFQGGYSGRHRISTGNLPDVLQAAFSTSDISGILGNAANKHSLAAFMHTDQAWRAIVATKNVADFKVNTSYRLGADAKFKKVGAGGELSHGTLSEESFTNQAETFGRMFAITRQDIINDDLGALTQGPKLLGHGAGISLNELIWKLFMDNLAFFTSARNNYAEGADTALSLAGLKTADTLLRKQKDAEGNPLGLKPAILLVPTGLRTDALGWAHDTEVNETTTANKAKPKKNPFSGAFKPVDTPYLSDTDFTGNSVLKWYLLADPRVIPVIEVAFLNGVQAPTIEHASADFKTLGIQMRGYHDVGVAMQDYRGGVAMKGEA